MGFTAVMNRAQDNFSWGSVLFNVRTALMAAIVLAPVAGLSSTTIDQ